MNYYCKKLCPLCLSSQNNYLTLLNLAVIPQTIMLDLKDVVCYASLLEQVDITRALLGHKTVIEWSFDYKLYLINHLK